MKLKATVNTDMIIQTLDVCVAEGEEVTLDLDDFEVVHARGEEWAKLQVKPDTPKQIEELVYEGFDRRDGVEHPCKEVVVCKINQIIDAVRRLEGK